MGQTKAKIDSYYSNFLKNVLWKAPSPLVLWVLVPYSELTPTVYVFYNNHYNPYFSTGLMLPFQKLLSYLYRLSFKIGSANTPVNCTIAFYPAVKKRYHSKMDYINYKSLNPTLGSSHFYIVKVLLSRLYFKWQG